MSGDKVVSQFGFLALEGLPVCRKIINADHYGSMGASCALQEAPMEPYYNPMVVFYKQDAPLEQDVITEQ